MVMSWLGINRLYIIISMKQSACHKFTFQDDTNLQAFKEGVLICDTGSDKNADIKCKKFFIIYCHRPHFPNTLIQPPLYISIIERQPCFLFPGHLSILYGFIL
jgi:hypothetical protein